MKSRLFRRIFVALTAMCLMHNADARVWRVNSEPGVQADFSLLNTAFSSALVLSGDTLYLEGSSVSHGTVELKKKLVIIGPGYFLSGAGANTGLQFNPNSNNIGAIYVDTLASGSVFMGVRSQLILDCRVDDIMITRCYSTIGIYNNVAGAKAVGLRITRSYLSISNFPVSVNLELTNNIINSSCQLNVAGTENMLFRNNLVLNAAAYINSAYVANCIFTSNVNTVNCTVRNNIATLNVLPAGNNNQNNITLANLFIGTGSTDGMYQLKAGSPAIAAGETINGETPDCGPFGTADPYRLSGIPAIPSIYALTVPASVPSSATSMTVTLSTRSNN